MSKSAAAAVKNNFCHRKHRDCRTRRQIRIIWSLKNLALQSRQIKRAGKPLPLIFVHALSNCLNRQATQAINPFACSGDTEKVSLFRSMTLSRQSSRQSLRRSTVTEITYIRFTRSFLFPEGLSFPFVNCGLNENHMIEIAESAFATNHLKLRALM